MTKECLSFVTIKNVFYRTSKPRYFLDKTEFTAIYITLLMKVFHICAKSGSAPELSSKPRALLSDKPVVDSIEPRAPISIMYVPKSPFLERVLCAPTPQYFFFTRALVVPTRSVFCKLQCLRKRLIGAQKAVWKEIRNKNPLIHPHQADSVTINVSPNITFLE